MKLKISLLAVLLSILTACGGGGGSAGAPLSGNGGGVSTSSTASSTSTTLAAPTLTLSFVDENGVDVIDHKLSQTLRGRLKVVLANAAANPVAYTRVTLQLDSAAALLVPANGTQLTDTAGIVLLPIAPASVDAAGTVRATATATVDGISLAQTYDLQIAPGVVGLADLTVLPQTVQKGQSVNVSVAVTVDGAAAGSNAVAVNFTSSCGVAAPASALVGATGRATAVIQTASSGTCSVSATASGVSAPTQPSFTVTLPPVTGLQFVSALPDVIYQAGSVGANTSVVTFKVIDSTGAAVTSGVKVNASLTNTDGGINFCNSPSFSTSGPDGLASFSVCAGSLPATVQVRATLDPPNQAVVTSSNLLTVQTGLPTQRFFDISSSQLNFYAGGQFTSTLNGNSVDISVFLADRQGNPVPDGTKIIFVSEGGQINSAGQSSCVISAGRCSVKLIGQSYRPLGSSDPLGDPRPGRVTVLAYTDGEESFIDANNNNRYDAGELFEDLGTLYLDKDESQTFNPKYVNLVTGTDEGEVSYPMPSNPVDGTPSAGSGACPVNSNIGYSVASTCNAKWDGYTKVRRAIVIVFSGAEIAQPGSYDASIPEKYQTKVTKSSASEIEVRLADRNGNPLPADGGLAVEVIPSTSLCKAQLLGAAIGSMTEPGLYRATLESCSTGDLVRFKLTVGNGNSAVETALDVVVP